MELRDVQNDADDQEKKLGDLQAKNRDQDTGVWEDKIRKLEKDLK